MAQDKFIARIETIVDGQRRSVCVLPRSRKANTFCSQSTALRAIEKTGIQGRGLVYPAEMNYADFYLGNTDWSKIHTIIL